MIDERTLRLDVLLAGMTERLRPLCAHWPQPVFDDMVRRLAEITVKYEGLVTPGNYDRRTTERLVAEMKFALEQSEAARQRESEGP